MKKSFLGYDIKETDEIVDSLRNQIDILSNKITRLNMKLSTQEENFAVEKALSEKSAAADPEVIAELKEQIDTLKSENDNLHNQISSLNSDLSQVKEEYSKNALNQSIINEANQNAKTREYDNIKQVGSIFVDAYTHVEMMRDEVSQEVKGRVEEYSKAMENAYSQMMETLYNIKQAKEKTSIYLVDSYEAMLENLEKFVEQSNTLEEQLSPIETIKGDLNGKIDYLMEQSYNDLKSKMPAELFEEVKEPAIEEDKEDYANLPTYLAKALKNAKTIEKSQNSEKDTKNDNELSDSDDIYINNVISYDVMKGDLKTNKDSSDSVEHHNKAVNDNNDIHLDSNVNLKDIFGKN